MLDWMGSEELTANFFRITQTEAKLRRDRVDTRAEANATHFQVGRAVRKTIEELGGTMPEQLPTPSENIKQVEQREQRRIEQAAQVRRQPSLFAKPAGGAEEGDGHD